MNSQYSAIAIVGETASGKTAAAIDIAEHIDGEIICADSRTVYKGLDIGTAKPTSAQQQRIKHHLVDILEPDQTYSAAQFQIDANKCIQDIQSRNKVPIIVGGTGLYVDALLYNFHFPKHVSSQDRDALEQMSEAKLTTLMLEKNIDSSALNTKNRRHIINALLRDGSVGTRESLPSNVYLTGIRLGREILKQRVSDRVATMFSEGFLNEVKQLTQSYGWENEALSGIGYRVARDHIEGRASEEEAKAGFIKGDLELAKRQRTWFKRNSDIVWFDDPKELVSKAIEFVSSFHYNKN